MGSDVFDAASEPEVERDRWGRYLLPHPETGKKQSWQRATTFAKAIKDTFALNEWQMRMLLKGAALHPDVVADAYSLDVKADKVALNALAEKLKEMAGAKSGANKGTAIHKAAELLDQGMSLEKAAAPQYRADVQAYTDALRKYGLEPVPHMVERRTCMPSIGVAGTLDRVYRTADGSYVIGDLKSAQAIGFAELETTVQLTVYAWGVNTAGVYDPRAKTWQAPGTEGVPEVRTDYAIVMHVPAGSGTCKPLRVDLNKGRRYVDLCTEVHNARRTRGLLRPYMQLPTLPDLDESAM